MDRSIPQSQLSIHAAKSWQRKTFCLLHVLCSCSWNVVRWSRVSMLSRNASKVGLAKHLTKPTQEDAAYMCCKKGWSVPPCVYYCQNRDQKKIRPKKCQNTATDMSDFNLLRTPKIYRLLRFWGAQWSMLPTMRRLMVYLPFSKLLNINIHV